MQAATTAILQDVYGLDAAHMKHRKYSGQLVPFTARDGANHNLVLGAALVPTEDLEQHMWVLERIKEGIGMAEALNKKEKTVISDRDKGIAGALSHALPNAHQSKCFKHILGNLKATAAKQKFPQLGLHEATAWAACKAESPAEFEGKLKELAAINPGKCPMHGFIVNGEHAAAYLTCCTIHELAAYPICCTVHEPT